MRTSGPSPARTSEHAVVHEAELARLPRNRLSERHRRWTYGVCAAVLFTGALWIAAHYLFPGDCEFGECRNSFEPWILRLHGASAFAALVQLGTLLPVHVLRAWRARQNRMAGATLLAGIGVLIATGYGLYYVAGETWRPLLSALHWILGLGLVCVFAAHLYVGRPRKHRDGQDHPGARAGHGRHAESTGGYKKPRRRHAR